MRHLLCSLALLVSVSTVFADDGQHLIVQQWVTPNSEGRMDAVIVSPGMQDDTLQPGQIQVKLASQDGTIYRAEAYPDSSREFSFAGVPAGTYTMMARGPELLACYAIHVVEQSNENIDPRLHILNVAAADLELDAVRRAIIRYLPATVPAVDDFDETAARTVMTSLSQTQTSRVALAAGGFSGRICRAGLDGDQLAGGSLINVLLYRDGKLVGQAVTGDDGSFNIDSVGPGQYALIAVGAEGFAVTSFELVDELVAGGETVSRESSNGSQLVSMQAPSSQPRFEMQLAPVGMDSPLIQDLLEDQSGNGAPPNSTPLSSPSGGGGGGGGVGGGGAGLGLAAAAIGLAALGSDDGGFSTPVASSPATP